MASTPAVPHLEQLAASAAPAPSETPLELIASTAVLFTVWLFVTTFVFQNFVIPSGSMEKTLLIGDHVLVDRTTFAPPTSWAPFDHAREPQRGDVIVFWKPNPETPDLHLVKRLVGLPGDRIRLHHGQVLLNGVVQNEPFAGRIDSGNPADAYAPARDDFPAHGPPPSSFTTEVWTQELPSHVVDGEIVVPPGKVFVMGDHRTQSADSRFWGFVPRENILGRPLFNYWSYAATAAEMEPEDPTLVTRIRSFLETGLHFFGKTRWSRTLHLIR